MGLLMGDTGMWRMYGAGRIVVRNPRGSRVFTLVCFSHYCFFIPPRKRSAFVHDFIRARKMYRDVKPFYVGDQLLIAADVIAYELMNRYYGRDVDPIN